MKTAKEARKIADRYNTVSSNKLDELYKEIEEAAEEGAYGLTTCCDLKLSYKERRTLEMDGFEVGKNPNNLKTVGYIIEW